MDGDLAAKPDDDALAPELASARQSSVLRSAFNIGDDYGSSSHLLPPPVPSVKSSKMSAPAILEPKTCVLCASPGRRLELPTTAQLSDIGMVPKRGSSL